MQNLEALDKKNIEVYLCRDVKKIAEILRRDYFDKPVCYFPETLLRALAHWIAKSNQAFLVTIEVDGKYAGFIFGHLLHPNLIWRQFARANPCYFPEIFWVWLRIRIPPLVNLHIIKRRNPERAGNPENVNKLQELNIQMLDRPFAWSPNQPHIGYIELTFIVKDYRGLGLSQYLRTRLCQEMSKNGINLIESHIDSNNYSSVCSVLKHGFEVFRMQGGDFYARKILTRKGSDEMLETRGVSTSEPYIFSFLSSSEVEKSADLRNEWERLLDSSQNLELLYQSTEWFEHLFTVDPYNNGLFLGIVKDNTGKSIGMVPIRIDKYTLSFDISSHMLWKIRLKTASILGSQPLVPQDENLYKLLFTTLLNNFPDVHCIYMGSVPMNSFQWQFLQRSRKVPENWILHVTDGIQSHHALLLPPTFEEYLSQFKRKKRWNLKRKVEKLRDHGGGRLEMIRVESADQIPSFVEAAVSVARNSWQQKRLGARIENNPKWHEKLKDLAMRGLLRAYLLKCGDRPCAFRLGYQFRDIYNSVQIAYDQSLAEFSPGTVLLYQVIEDLFRYKTPRKLNFGLSDTPHKREFGNFHFEAAEILLWRSTFPNRIKRTSHLAFRGGISLIKTYLHKRKSPLAGEET